MKKILLGLLLLMSMSLLASDRISNKWDSFRAAHIEGIGARQYGEEPMPCTEAIEKLKIVSIESGRLDLAMRNNKAGNSDLPDGYAGTTVEDIALHNGFMETVTDLVNDVCTTKKGDLG